MITTDEDALICDLAETYQIYDYKSLPLQRVAIFCIGLRDDSRIKMKLSGCKYSINTMLLASATDYLALLYWAQTKDAQQGLNRPSSVLDILLERQEDGDKVIFNTAEEFEAKRREILEKGGVTWN